MKINQHDWEKALVKPPTIDGGISPQLMQRVRQQVLANKRAAISPRNNKRRKRWLGGVSLLLLAMIFVFTAQKQQWLWPGDGQLDPNEHYMAGGNEHGPHHLPQDDLDIDGRQVERVPEDGEVGEGIFYENVFDSKVIEVGDLVKGWRLTEIHHNYFDAPGGTAVMFSFEGEMTISGTYEYIEDAGEWGANYNVHDVVFTMDEMSRSEVPIPQEYVPIRNKRIVLDFDQDEHMEVFGPLGALPSKGEATIVISDFHTLLGEGFDGVIDHARVGQWIDVRPFGSESESEGGRYEVAVLPDEDIALLYSEETDGVVLVIGEAEYYYDWGPDFSPRNIQPQLHVADFDGDGEKQLAIIIPFGSGTGISIDRLYMVDLSNGQDNTFTDYIEQLQDMTAYTTSMSDGQLNGELMIGTEVYPMNLSSLLQFGEIGDEVLFGNIENFAYENNSLTARIGVALQTNHSNAPIYIGLIYADVRYDGGRFILHNVMFEVGDEFVF